MAKAYSSTAPNKPAAAPVATRRSARSKSVEPTEPAKDEVAPAKGKRGGKKGKAAAKVKTPDLAVVDENEGEDAAAEDDVPQDDQDALLAAQLNAEEEPIQPSPSRRSVAASAISGTTAKTSFSMEELESMDHEMILPGLPHLYTASENVVRELLPASTATTPATWKDIRLAGTKVNKRYDRHLKSLMSYKEDFGSQEYIRPDIVLRKILNVSSMEEVMPAIWRPDNIIFKINLALMLKNILIVCDPADWTMAATAAIEHLDMAFPGGIAGGEFNLAALQFWLDLAAQITIRRLEAVIESDPNFTPHAEIDNVFFDDEGTFKHATSLGFEGADEQNLNEANRMITDQVDSLKKPFAGNDGTGATAANGKLKSQFRWDAFVDHALSYFQSRSFELDARIEQAGGVSEIIKALDHECERREDERIAERFKAAKSSSTARRSFGGKNAMAALKQRQKQIAQQPAPVAPMTAPSMLEANPDILTQDFANDQENGPQNPYNTAQTIAKSSLQAVASFQKLQNANARAARARLTDRQPGAVRIDNRMWGDEDSQTVQYEVPGDDANQLPYGRSPARGKRTYQAYANDEEDFNPTQDEGFQTDTRDLGGADLQRRREKSFGKAPARHQSAEPGSSAVAGPSNYHSSPARPSPAKRQRKNPGSEIPASMPPYAPTDGEAPSSERFKRAKIEAKQNRVLASQEKPQQLRRPWSDAEENALIQLIENHGEGGISYSGLKAIDNEYIAAGEAQLVGRTAEDMRFKARNMKVTFLRARQGLPRYWEHVVLGAKEKKQLADRGIDYQQERIRASRMRDFEGEAELMAQLEAASNAG